MQIETLYCFQRACHPQSKIARISYAVKKRDNNSTVSQCPLIHAVRNASLLWARISSTVKN